MDILYLQLLKSLHNCGYADIYTELNAQGKIAIEERGAPFQMMPTTEPDFYCEIWTMNVS